MASVDALNDSGKSTVAAYAGACRSRDQNASRALDNEFRRFCDSNVLQDTFTKAEVGDLLESYFRLMKVTLHSQSSDSALAHADVLSQVYKAGESKGKTLSTSAYEQAELESKMATLEEDIKFPSSPGAAVPAQIVKPDVDLPKEIQKTKDDTAQLKEKAKVIQDQYNAMMREKQAVQAELDETNGILDAVKKMGSSAGEAFIDKLGAELEKINGDTAKYTEESKAKLSESSQFQTMKNKMQRYTEEIKSARERLAKVKAELPNDDEDED